MSEWLGAWRCRRCWMERWIEGYKIGKVGGGLEISGQMVGWLIVTRVFGPWYGSLDNWMTEWMDRWRIGERNS